MSTSMKHSFDQLQTRTQNFYGVYKNSNFISKFSMTELIIISRLIKTLHNCVDHE